MRTIYIAVLSLVCFSTEVYGQSVEELRQMNYQMIERQREINRKNIEEVRATVNKNFSIVLGHEWKAASEKTVTHNPIRDIPSVPPEKAPKGISDPFLKTDDRIIRVEKGPKKSLYPITEIVDNPQGSQTRIRSSFYGCQISVRFDLKDRIYLQSNNPSGVKTLWDKFSSIGYTNLIYDFNDIRRRLDLCDWATLKLAQKVSEMVYGNNDSNESVILQSYLLSQCGLLTSFLYDTNSQLHLLIAADKQLDDYPEYNVDGVSMFQVDLKDVDENLTPHNSFDGLAPFRMAISRPGLLAGEPQKTDKGANVNSNYISFYSDYPVFYDAKDQLSMYYYVASVSLSDEVQKTLYPYLRSKMEGYNEVECVQLLLVYFYKIFRYEVDENVWGEDRRFFPEETLFYKFSDCEDNAILFSRIVRDLLGLKTVLVYMPEHVCAAVRFSEYVPGDAEVVNGERYVICDPTFSDAVVGQGMDRWKNSKTIVIEL